jgi:hypothetical protein
VISTGIHVASANHVPLCTPVEYATNPPSGGDHWPIWAEYTRFDAPVPRPKYVHNLEHGAVVLLHRCEGACPEVTDALEAVQAATPIDVACAIQVGGPHARFVMTPDDAIDTPIAAAAWGATYTATCVDEASLSDFIARVYAKGPEDTCAPPPSGSPECD